MVEMDITQKEKASIIIGDHEGKKIQQPIEYEWKPLYCETCQKIGHVCNKEKNKMVKQWKEKEIMQEILRTLRWKDLRRSEIMFLLRGLR